MDMEKQISDMMGWVGITGVYQTPQGYYVEDSLNDYDAVANFHMRE